MTKLNWEKANRRLRDPGALIDVKLEPTKPLMPYQERQKRQADLAQEKREREYSSKLHDIELAGPRSPEWLLQLSESRKRQKYGRPLSTLDKAVLEMATQECWASTYRSILDRWGRR
jgi:hypothetical protein